MSESPEAEAIKAILPPGLSHIETSHSNMTFINDPTKFEALKKEANEPGVIKIPMPGGLELRLVDFTQVRDIAGVELLNFKVKPEHNVVLYQITDHPNSEDALIRLRVKFIEKGLGHFEFRDVEEDIAEYKKMYDNVLNGAVKPEPGCHPKMQYLEEK